MLNVSIIKCLSDNYSYLLHDKNTNTVGVVDPSEFSVINQEIEKKYKKLDFIFNTHHHDDHVGGNLDLKEKYGSKIICSKKDINIIQSVDIALDDGDIFSFGETDFDILHIPGHTLGHIAFYSKKAGVVFTGDTLFSLGCGRIFEGTFEQMFNSLEKIINLSKDTLIYCGHEYTKKNGEFCISIDRDNKTLKDRIEEINDRTKKNLPTLPVSLASELENNIFLRCNNIKIKKNLKMENASKFQVFKKLRNLKDQF